MRLTARNRLRPGRYELPARVRQVAEAVPNIDSMTLFPEETCTQTMCDVSTLPQFKEEMCDVSTLPQLKEEMCDVSSAATSQQFAVEAPSAEPSAKRRMVITIQVEQELDSPRNPQQGAKRRRNGDFHHPFLEGHVLTLPPLKEEICDVGKLGAEEGAEDGADSARKSHTDNPGKLGAEEGAGADSSRRKSHTNNLGKLGHFQRPDCGGASLVRKQNDIFSNPTVEEREEEGEEDEETKRTREEEKKEKEDEEVLVVSEEEEDEEEDSLPELHPDSCRNPEAPLTPPPDWQPGTPVVCQKSVGLDVDLDDLFGESNGPAFQKRPRWPFPRRWPSPSVA